MNFRGYVHLAVVRQLVEFWLWHIVARWGAASLARQSINAAGEGFAEG